MAHTYGISEAVGTLTTSIDEAITTALSRPRAPCGLDWFEVSEISSHIEESAVAHYQVCLKIGFRRQE